MQLQPAPPLLERGRRQALLELLLPGQEPQEPGLLGLEERPVPQQVQVPSREPRALLVQVTQTRLSQTVLPIRSDRTAQPVRSRRRESVLSAQQPLPMRLVVRPPPIPFGC